MVHGSHYGMTRAPFTSQRCSEVCLMSWPSAYSQGGASKRCAPTTDGVCMSVCCATLLSNEIVGSACGQARSSDLRGRACRPNGKGTG